MGKEIQICEIVVECYIFRVLSSIMQRAVKILNNFWRFFLSLSRNPDKIWPICDSLITNPDKKFGPRRTKKGSLKSDTATRRPVDPTHFNSTTDSILPTHAKLSTSALFPLYSQVSPGMGKSSRQVNLRSFRRLLQRIPIHRPANSVAETHT